MCDGVGWLGSHGGGGEGEGREVKLAGKVGYVMRSFWGGSEEKV